MESIRNLRRKTFEAAGSRWLLVAVAGLVGAAAYLLLHKTKGKSPGIAARQGEKEHIVDDRGTGQLAALQILRNLRDRAFEASGEKLALALGRPLEQVVAWEAGQEVIDDDVVMKARSIGRLRGIIVE